MTGMSNAAELRTLAIDAIGVEEGFNPRSASEPERLVELTESIRQHGVLQPILAAPAEGGGYTVIAGHRRLAAARAAGLTEIPAVVREAGGGRSSWP